MSRRSSRRASQLGAATLVPVLLSLPLSARDRANPVEYNLTVFQVWASKQPKEGEPPKELRRYLKELKKRSGGNSFRLEGKPLKKRLKAGEKLPSTLPRGYSARWEVTADGEATLRQVLINPKKEKSVVRVKKSPVITTLARIRRGEEVFLLVLEFEKVARHP